MDENLYNKEIVCPVCKKHFNVTKVKMRACKVERRDTDFCVYYKGINPLFYDVWVCEHCGYAAQSDKFPDIPEKEAVTLLQQLTDKWNKRSLAGERNVDTAIEAYKLALVNHQLRNAKASELAKVCLRIAWLYRIKGDEKENYFIKYALKYYLLAFENERFPLDKLDEDTCMYIIGELSRRSGNYEEAAKWYSRVIGSPSARRNQTLMSIVRDQYQVLKSSLNNS